MNEERTGKCLRQEEHIRGHLPYSPLHKQLFKVVLPLYMHIFQQHNVGFRSFRIEYV